MKRNVKVNLGCGPDGIDGWVNFDWGWLPLLSKFPIILSTLTKFNLLAMSYLRKWPKIVLHDLRRGIPLNSNSIDWIYHSNFAEHLEKYELLDLLNECFRVLKRSGKMRLVVPDLDKISKDYMISRDSDRFCREFYGYDKDIDMGFKNIAVRGHQWMYDEKSILKLLIKAGFKKMQVSSYRNSLMPDVDKLDLPIHKNLCLYIEVEKT